METITEFENNGHLNYLNDPDLTNEELQTIKALAESPELLKQNKPRSAEEFYVRLRASGQNISWQEAKAEWQKWKKSNRGQDINLMPFEAEFEKLDAQRRKLAEEDPPKPPEDQTLKIQP